MFFSSLYFGPVWTGPNLLLRKLAFADAGVSVFDSFIDGAGRQSVDAAAYKFNFLSGQVMRAPAN
jgi:hypothetical protein